MPDTATLEQSIKAIEIVTLGETMLTIRPRADEDAFAWEVGGAESNVARCCAALGVRTAWVSQLGADLAGDLVLSTIRDAGVDVSNVRRISERQTGLMLKEADASERRVWYYRRDSAAAAMSVTLPFQFASKPQILHLTGITLGLSPTCHELVQAFVADRTRASVVSFDVNWRPTIWENEPDAAELLRATANRCDVVFVGLDEAVDLWGAPTIEAIRDLLPQADMIVVKDGANSAHAHTNDGWHEVPALKGPIVDSVGAGDAFAAGFLAGCVRHQADVESCLRLGHITAMGALSQLSDVGTVADDETTRRLLAMSADEWASTTLDLSTPALRSKLAESSATERTELPRHLR